VKAYHLYSNASHTCSCSRAVCHRQGLAFSLDHSPFPHTRTLDTAVIRSPSLQYNGLHPHIYVNYMDYYSVIICLRNDRYCVGWGIKLYSLTHSVINHGGMKGWVGLVGGPILTAYLPTIDLAQVRKVCWSKTDILTTELCCHILLFVHTEFENWQLAVLVV